MTSKRSNKGKVRSNPLATVPADSAEIAADSSSGNTHFLTPRSASSQAAADYANPLSTRIVEPAVMSQDTEDVVLASGTVQQEEQIAHSVQEELLPIRVDEDGAPHSLTMTVIEPLAPHAQPAQSLEENMAMEIDLEGSHLMDDEDDLFALADVEVPDEDLSEARITVEI
ncbi:hypothetical protein BGX28_002295 [Mortierella sp. GBA30]|nr:hypothetical protein BGX28_002295 [Mortierella sp. GBA30]